MIKGKKAFIFREDISWDDRSPRGVKVLVQVLKNQTLTNHSASGHQLESCTLKGFDPYIHKYMHTKYQNIHKLSITNILYDFFILPYLENDSLERRHAAPTAACSSDSIAILSNWGLDYFQANFTPPWRQFEMVQFFCYFIYEVTILFCLSF